VTAIYPTRRGRCGTNEGFSDKIDFIWSVADLLRGDYRAPEYGQVILPLTVLRRLDCVLEPTKAAVIAKAAALEGRIGDRDPILLRAGPSRGCGT
jgi:type I restriction enzyme M protein